MELQRYLNNQNKRLLNKHTESSDKVYNQIIARLQKLEKLIAEEKVSTKESKLRIESMKKQAFEDIERLLEEDTALLLPLLFKMALYAYNGHIKALAVDAYTNYKMRNNDVYEYDQEVKGEYMDKALKDNVIKFKMHVSLAFASYRNNVNKDFHRASKRVMKRLNYAYAIYKRKFKNILWQETRRVVESFKYLSVKALTYALKLNFDKQWITKDDDLVRDTRLASHTAMNNVKIKWDKEFKLVPSGQTLFPRGSGIPVQDINCRCILKYSVRGA